MNQHSCFVTRRLGQEKSHAFPGRFCPFLSSRAATDPNPEKLLEMFARAELSLNERRRDHISNYEPVTEQEWHETLAEESGQVEGTPIPAPIVSGHRTR